MEEKNNKKNYLIYAIVLVVLLIVTTIAISYAYFKLDNASSGTTTLTTTFDCVDISLSDNSTTLKLSHNYPITDELALTSGSITPLTIKVTNNCTNSVQYSLALSTLSLTSNTGNYITDSKIRYKLLKNSSNYKGIDYLSNMTKVKTTSELYSKLAGTSGELATKYSSYTLKQIYSIDDLVTIAANGSNTYNLYMWVDYYEGDSAMYSNSSAVHDESYDGTTEGKKFAAAISLSFDTDGASNIS